MQDNTNHNRLAEQMAARIAEPDPIYVEHAVRQTAVFEARANGDIPHHPRRNTRGPRVMQTAAATIERQPSPPPAIVSAAEPTPMMIVHAACASGNVDMYREAVNLVKEMDIFAARKAFSNAIAAARAKIPPIKKNRRVGFDSRKPGAGRTDYAHEDMAEIARTIDGILAEFGLSYRFRTSSEISEPVRVTCIISHRDGHCEETTLTAGRDDDNSNKNTLQRIGSTVTYLQRYTLKAALGLAASEDDDGRGGEAAIKTEAPPPAEGSVSPVQAANIRDALKNKGAPESDFLAWAKKKRIEDILAVNYDRCMRAISNYKQSAGA